MAEEDTLYLDGYETFDTLLDNIAYEQRYLPEVGISRIRYVAAILTRVRQTCAADAPLDAAELMQLLVSLEDIGARGWYLAWKSQRSFDEMWHKLRDELKAKDEELERVRERNRNLEAERDELSQHLSQVVKRLEPLASQFDQLHVTQPPDDSVPPPNRPGSLPEIDENDDEIRTYGSAWGDEKLPSPQELIDTHRRRSSSIVTEVGDALHNPATSYPPPLAPATEEARKTDERRTSMLSEVENTLWIQESKDREYLLKRPGPPPTTAQPPPSFRADYPDSLYIYIPLPANFIIPQAQSHPQLPSLVFPTPPAVFHFPDFGTREQLLQILRKGCADGVGNRYLEPVEDINIIRVRTHELEWELKNAIRKIMTEEDWDDLVGDDWFTEGRGDTYIVSKRDVHFRMVGCESKAGHENLGKPSHTADDESNHNRADQEHRKEVVPEKRQHKEKESESAPQLRGGTLSPLPSFPSSSSPEISDSSQSLRNLRYCCESNPFVPVYEHVTVERLQAWIDQACFLQLQNASHGRMVSHLEEIIKDMKETVEWQDEELASAHRQIRRLQRKMRQRTEETLVAGRMAQFAKAETRLLQEQLDQIHSQVVEFCAELDEHERHVLAHYPEFLPCESSTAAELRGGGGESPHEIGTSSSVQAPEETTMQAVEASSFYFFPSVSMVVLLSNPLHHFQFPKHTTLARVRQMLQNLHTEGRETDAHLRQVREIFEARDEAGLALPDTSNGRQVLISAPDISDDSTSIASGKPGYKGIWNRTFGPSEYQYERILKESIDSLKPPPSESRSVLSPTASGYEGRFHNSGVLVNTISPLDSPEEDEFYNAGQLIDTIEHEAEISRVRSAQKLSDLCKEAPKSRSRADSLGERRGYAMSLPLPPTSLEPIFATGSGAAPEYPRLKHPVATRTSDEEEHLSPRPIGTTGVKAWRLENHPVETPKSPTDDLERGPLFDYEKAPTNSNEVRQNPLSTEQPYPHLDPSPQPTENSDESVACRQYTEGGWVMWRHRKGEACEAWMTPSSLDPRRTTCIFCGLPFAEQAWKKWECDANDASTSHPSSGDALRTPQKRQHEDAWGPDIGPSNPYLRGGAEEVEWALLQHATYDAGFVNWADEMSAERPPSPRKKSVVEDEDGKIKATVHGRCHRSCKGLVLQNHVRFAEGGKDAGVERFGVSGRDDV